MPKYAITVLLKRIRATKTTPGSLKHVLRLLMEVCNAVAYFQHIIIQSNYSHGTAISVICLYLVLGGRNSAWVVFELVPIGLLCIASLLSVSFCRLCAMMLTVFQVWISQFTNLCRFRCNANAKWMHLLRAEGLSIMNLRGARSISLSICFDPRTAVFSCVCLNWSGAGVMWWLMKGCLIYANF